MTGLFNPANRRRDGIKWGLVSYTVVVFSLATVVTGTGLNLGSISFIDNRDYPGSVEGDIAPGPLGYQLTIYQKAVSMIPSIMFLLGYWLADGLLVGSSFGPTHPPRCLMPIPLAISLLRDLCREPLGHRGPQPHVPCLFGYALEFSTRLRLSGLMSLM